MHRLHAHSVVLLAHSGAAGQGGGMAEWYGHVGGWAVPDGWVDKDGRRKTLEVGRVPYNLLSSSRLAGVCARIKVTHLHYDQGLVLAENIIIKIFSITNVGEGEPVQDAVSPAEVVFPRIRLVVLAPLDRIPFRANATVELL